LARRGVPFRIISEADAPGEHSRAIAVCTRVRWNSTASSGSPNEVVAQGVVADSAHIREGGDHDSAHVVTHFKDLGDGISPYPFALAYAQDDHERFLIGKLKEVGVNVEWQSKPSGFTEENGNVRAAISCNGGTEEVYVEYMRLRWRA
jgi:hypothetical protein